ncbi:MAG: branched-chain amino acid aminotransferase [Holophagaceae bacterium]
MKIDLKPLKQVLSKFDREVRMTNPGFGRVFSEHMVISDYEASSGWSTPILQPYGPITLDPAASILHYGQSIFEGLKCYAQKNGNVSLFRPVENWKRMNESAHRLAMPSIPEDLFISAAEALVRQDRSWVSDKRGESLYLRPLMFATEAALGVRPSISYRFVLFASPCGSYFPQGYKAVSVWLSEDYIRAAPGGTGAAKFAGNYGASLIGQKQAIDHGCDQVVWLDAREHRYLEEMGGMNICLVEKKNNQIHLVTPELTGTILPGITRLSLIQISKDLDWGFSERRISTQEWQEKSISGEFSETFACGTAAVITPIREVKSRTGSWLINQGTIGPVALQLREYLLDLQHGEIPDSHGWLHPIN